MRTWVLGLVLAAGCKSEATEGTWLRFNGDEDVLTMAITADEALGEVVTAPLSSTTGATEVGVVSVDPGTGPVGTDHRFLLEVDDAYEDRVKRVEVTIAAGGRNTELFSFSRDSADMGVWLLEITSYGIEGEEREDVATFALYEVAEDLPSTDTDEDAE